MKPQPLIIPAPILATRYVLLLMKRLRPGMKDSSLSLTLHPQADTRLLVASTVTIH
jgi:hypothetical protein